MLSRLHLPFDLKLKQVRSLPKSRAVRAFAAPALRPWTEIPGPSSKPELGGTAADLGARLASLGPYGAMMSYYNEFGKIMKHDMMGRPEVWIFHPLEAMKVFANEGGRGGCRGLSAHALRDIQIKSFGDCRKISYRSHGYDLGHRKIFHGQNRQEHSVSFGRAGMAKNAHGDAKGPLQARGC